MAHSSLISRLQGVSRCFNRRYMPPFGTTFSTSCSYSSAAPENTIEKSELDKPKVNKKPKVLKSKMRINVQQLMSENEITFDKQVRKTQKNESRQVINSTRQGNVTEIKLLNEDETKLLKEVVESIKATTELSATVKMAFDSLQKCKKAYFRNTIVVKFLKRARLLQPEANIADIIKTQEFKSLLEYLQNNLRSLDTWNLISCLRSLVLFPSEESISKLVFALEREMSSRLRYTNIHLLIVFYQIVQRQGTKQGKRLLFQCEEQLKRRIPRKPQELMLLMSHFAHKKESNTFIRLEDHVFDMISQLSLDNYCDIINYLAVYGSRNTSLIYLVLFYINKTFEQRTLEQLSSLLFSCGKLAIYDTELFKKLSGNLLALKPTSAKKTCSILKSMSILGWRSTETISHLLDFLVDSNIELESSTLESTLQALATLNYCPRHKLEILKSICTQVNVDEISQLQLLNMVWSLAVLQESSSQLVTSVLEPGFIGKLQESGYEKWQYQLKLVGVNNAAVFDLKDSSRPLLPDDLLSYRPQDQAMKSKLIDDVLSTLKKISGNELRKTHVSTQYGYKIDAELIVDQSGCLVKFSDDQESEKYNRVAIRVQGFHDLTIPDNIPKGPEAMMIRHLACQGYKVLTIPFYEWSSLKSDEKKLNYLKNKINNVVL